MNEAFVNYIHNNRFYQQIQNSGLGIDNLLPYLPKGHPTASEYDDRSRRIKARASVGATQSSKETRAIDRSKSKQNIHGKDEKT